MDVYPLVLPHKMNRSLEGLHVICIRLWRRKVIHGVFTWLVYKYEEFDRKQDGETL